MKAYVINLEKDIDRREYMRRLMLDSVFESVEFVKGIYCKSLNYAQQSEIFDRHRFGHVFSDSAFEGEIGCAVSHFNVWRMIADRDDKFAFVLEDDVCFDDDFAPISKWSARWLDSSRPRVVLFSHNFYYYPWNKAGDGHYMFVTRTNKAFGTFCYGVNRAGARLLVSLGKPHYISDEWDYFQRQGLEMRLPLVHPVSVNFKFDTNIKQRSAYLLGKLDAGALLIEPCYFSLASECFKRLLFRLGIIRLCSKG